MRRLFAADYNKDNGISDTMAADYLKAFLLTKRASFCL